MRTAKYERFGLAQYAPLLVIAFGEIAKTAAIEVTREVTKELARDILQEIGKDIWKGIKKKLASIISNRHEVSEVEFHYSYGPKNVELKVRSADGNVIASAFDQIQKTVETVERTKADIIYFEFDLNVNKWALVSQQMSGDRKVLKRFDKYVIASVKEVTVRGYTYAAKEKVLMEAARTWAGQPLNYDHNGPSIGRIEHSWYEDGKLFVNAVVFEPTDDAQRTQVEKMLDLIKSGKRWGFSMGFSFNSKSKSKINSRTRPKSKSKRKSLRK